MDTAGVTCWTVLGIASTAEDAATADVPAARTAATRKPPHGENAVATTVVGEKAGWLSLAAYNFGFSSPQVKVQLTQAAEPTPTPSATAKTVAKKITITCIKGKVTKKVTAVNPKCPTGYKKKG